MEIGLMGQKFLTKTIKDLRAVKEYDEIISYFTKQEKKLKRLLGRDFGIRLNFFDEEKFTEKNVIIEEGISINIKYKKQVITTLHRAYGFFELMEVLTKLNEISKPSNINNVKHHCINCTYVKRENDKLYCTNNNSPHAWTESDWGCGHWMPHSKRSIK